MRIVRRMIGAALAALFFALILQGDAIPPKQVFDRQIDGMMAGRHFNFVRWEAAAIAGKLGQTFRSHGGNPGWTEQKALVVEYFSTTQRIRELEEEVKRIYSTTEREEAARASLPLRLEIKRLRQHQEERRGAVETILEEQTKHILLSQGFGLSNFLWPPVKFRFSQTPLYLVISPRDRIEVRKAVYLWPDLDLEEQEAIEEEIDHTFNVSSLIVGTGGVGAYPTMIAETPSLRWVLETIAHEWTHNYLAFKPLGWHYEDSYQLRTMNETVASIVGDEVGGLVLSTYYPELVPPEGKEERHQPKPGEFDFNQEMRKIRLKVDELLAQGKVEEAEQFMEERRRYLASHGHYIRKLNQAYFAFYGSYATGPASVDPIGEKLKELRARSASLKEFVDRVSMMTSYEDLERALEADWR